MIIDTVTHISLRNKNLHEFLRCAVCRVRTEAENLLRARRAPRPSRRTRTQIASDYALQIESARLGASKLRPLAVFFCVRRRREVRLIRRVVCVWFTVTLFELRSSVPVGTAHRHHLLPTYCGSNSGLKRKKLPTYPGRGGVTRGLGLVGASGPAHTDMITLTHSFSAPPSLSSPSSCSGRVGYRGQAAQCRRGEWFAV